MLLASFLSARQGGSAVLNLAALRWGNCMAMVAAGPSDCDEEQPPLLVRSGIHSPPEKEQTARLCLSEFCRSSKKLTLYHECRLEKSDSSGYCHVEGS